ncbi:beta-N-acetylhexosaminidase [Gilvimarinus polysaccharolyticus]|uniref:beta-N-acetylhexosaminidase n=1 Tax=Gilvimarinus polysaccharolyticus TaxID=863921 RepID=UPI00067360B8|nr:family 20 glycosylhydrolase [Gilvimarinus polysaccharolyticus]
MLLTITKRRIFGLVLMVFLTAQPWVATQASPVQQEPIETSLALMPYPKNIVRMAGSLKIVAPLQLENPAAASERVSAALVRLNTMLLQRSGLNDTAKGPLIRLRSRAKNSAVIQAPAATLERADESYQLTVNEAGITVVASTDLAVLRALTTLMQLAGDNGSVEIPFVIIDDAPRFTWRGLLLDSVRHFLSVETIKRQIDGMAAAKLNVLHWHLTDDQGWRFESQAYPKLTQLASGGQFYSRAEIKQVVAYAEARGIYVLPEIDMPGHSSAIAVAYPELMSAPGPYLPEDRWGVHKPLLNPANEAVYIFASAIFQEVAELFPFPYVHIGGDEIDPEHWHNNSDIQAFMATKQLPDTHALHTYFNSRLAAMLAQLDRTMVGWDEVLHSDLAKGTVVQSWQGPDALARAVNAGFPALLSTGFYLDQPQSSAYHYRVMLQPEALNIKTNADGDEPWRSWRFVMPRKRGSAVSGTLSVIGGGDTLRGFVDFNGKSRADVSHLTWQDDQVGFFLDTWMGPVQAHLKIAGDTISGPVLVANAPYELSGKLIASNELVGTTLPLAISKDIIAEQNMSLVLGGEAALWGEMVDEHNIDVRLWPRAFAVAERLWSSRELRDSEFMHQRLDVVSRWAERVVGLRHIAQQVEALARLPASQRKLALMLSSALEPAQYYHRHHEKSVSASYSRRDTLDNFVDTLPAESRAAQKFSANLKRWRVSRKDTAALVAAIEQLTKWQQAAQLLADELQRHDPADLLPICKSVQQVSTWGLRWLAAEADATPLTKHELEKAQAELKSAMQIQQEMIVAPAHILFNMLVE